MKIQLNQNVTTANIMNENRSKTSAQPEE